MLSGRTKCHTWWAWASSLLKRQWAVLNKTTPDEKGGKPFAASWGSIAAELCNILRQYTEFLHAGGWKAFWLHVSELQSKAQFNMWESAFTAAAFSPVCGNVVINRPCSWRTRAKWPVEKWGNQSIKGLSEASPASLIFPLPKICALEVMGLAVTHSVSLKGCYFKRTAWLSRSRVQSLV